MKLIQDTNYQKPLLQIEDEMSIHYDTNIENQIPNSVSECVICGKGIKATSKNYSIVAGLGNLPGVALSGMGLGVFEEFADYILGTEFRIGSVFLLLVLILVYRRFKLSRKREYLK